MRGKAKENLFFWRHIAHVDLLLLFRVIFNPLKYGKKAQIRETLKIHHT